MAVRSPSAWLSVRLPTGDLLLVSQERAGPAGVSVATVRWSLGPPPGAG
ncbi:hypothetical protein [Streptomyces luteolifulvus]